MNIDTKIQEILLRSSPINDNGLPQKTIMSEQIPSLCRSISIVGDRNVVISSSSVSALMAFTLFYMFMFYYR